MELQNIRRIGIFKFRNIGDVLLMTPALRALRERFPKAKVTVVVNEGTEGVLAHNPDVDEVLILRRAAGQSFAERLFYGANFLWQLWRRCFDLTVSFTEGDRSAWYSLFCHASYRIGWKAHHRAWWHPPAWAYTHGSFPPDWLDQHEVAKHFYLLEKAGLSLPSFPLRLVVMPEDQLLAREKLQAFRPRPIVHVHPVSRWLWKCWDNSKMAEVIDGLHDSGWAVVVTTGPNERERQRARELVELCRTQPLFLDGTIKLPQLAALIQEARLFLGVDTAPMHIAAAVGTPVVALFGPTNAANWAPWQVPHRIVKRPCLCNQNGDKERCDWSATRQCLAEISVRSVQQAVADLVDSTTAASRL